MTTAPPKPSRLSLWMAAHGRPNQLRVENRLTGVDTGITVIHLSVLDYYNGKVLHSIEVSPGEIPLEGRTLGVADVVLSIDHAHVADWTSGGRQRLEAWQTFEKKEKSDIAEYKRLRAKFGDAVP